VFKRKTTRVVRLRTKSTYLMLKYRKTSKLKHK